MTKELTNPSFDYSQVDKETKGKLIYFEGELFRSRDRVANEYIQHGEILYGAQQALANHSGGIFMLWLESVGVSKSSAYRHIEVFVEFGSFPNVGKLEVSAMVALTSNLKAKKKALRLADKGVKVTHSMAKQLIEETNSNTNNGGPGNAGSSDGSTKGGPSDADRNRSAAILFSGEDDGTDAQGTEPQEPSSRRRGSAKAEPADYGKCPNCAGVKWLEDNDGAFCEKCHQPHGEPAGDVDAERIKTQRQKTVKTIEALMRAFDDLNTMVASTEHTNVIVCCKAMLKTAKGWK